MRNRAKCKLCKSIIESYHRHDHVTCDCGEIAVDGGTEIMRCVARDWVNFIRLDDQDNEIIPKIVNNDVIEQPINHELPPKPSRNDLLDMLDRQIKDIESLPPHAMTTPITHYDYLMGLLLLRSLLRSD
jgi:hypothetical protein